MKYKLYKNSKYGTHCVQACLKTLLYYFDMPILSFKQLDEITGHKPDKFTWMTKALLWLSEKGFNITNIEDIDYEKFAKHGANYLKSIWDKETFDFSNKYSDLAMEQRDAKLLIKNKNILLMNDRYGVEEIKLLFKHGYFILLSVNPHVLNGREGYGSHLVVIAGFKNGKVNIVDSDKGIVWHDESQLEKAISPKNKPDFSMTLVSLR